MPHRLTAAGATSSKACTSAAEHPLLTYYAWTVCLTLACCFAYLSSGYILSCLHGAAHILHASHATNTCSSQVVCVNRPCGGAHRAFSMTDYKVYNPSCRSSAALTVRTVYITVPVLVVRKMDVCSCITYIVNTYILDRQHHAYDKLPGVAISHSTPA